MNWTDFALKFLLLVIYGYVWYKLGYNNGRFEEQKKASAFIDAILAPLEEKLNEKTKKRAKRKPKA